MFRDLDSTSCMTFSRHWPPTLVYYPAKDDGDLLDGSAVIVYTILILTSVTLTRDHGLHSTGGILFIVVHHLAKNQDYLLKC